MDKSKVARFLAYPVVYINAFLFAIHLFVSDDDTKMIIDCDSRSREEIHKHIKQILGKTE